MFTGLIHHCGEISAISRAEQSIRLNIQSDFTDIVLGESIAVDGICLTVTNFCDQQFECELSSETLRLTQAQYYQVGSKVNLERSLRVGDRLGGHWVTGHVDGMAQWIEQHEQQNFKVMTFKIPIDNQWYLVSKGSVAINGVSLTINSVEEGRFSIMLIPHTLAITNLKHLKLNDFVNIEYDYLAKLTVSFVKRSRELIA